MVGTRKRRFMEDTVVVSPKKLKENIVNENSSPKKKKPISEKKVHGKNTSKQLNLSVKIEIENEDPETFSEDTAEEEENKSLAKRMSENVADNAAFFAKLGMHTAKLQFDEVKDINVKKPSSRGLKEKKAPEVITERRKSLRIQNKDPTGESLPEQPYIAPLEEYERIRKEGPLTMTDVLNNDDEEGSHSKFLTSLQNLKIATKLKHKLDPDLKRFVKSTDSMSINELLVAKVVPQRIFSMAINPTTDKILAAAGDKRGNIGFWDVNSSSNQDGVFCYKPHVSPVKHLVFPQSQTQCLYSASYDGSLRCCHFEKGVFDELYTTPDDEDIIVTGFDFFTPTSLVVSQGAGGLAMVDTRESSDKHTLYEISQKTTRSVSVHPVHRDYIATAHADSNVYIWDVRKLDKKKPKYVHNMPHSRIVECAFFSPVRGDHLVTTSDVYRLYNTADVGSKAELAVNIRHNNHTGRWLSKFRAVWHPVRDDVFISGSMNKPRQIELFDTKGQIIKTFLNPDYLCSVCSLNAFHPTLNVLVGGNSSGRVHVFK